MISTLGNRFEYRLPTDTPTSLTANLGWKHIYGTVTPQSVQHFNGSIDFTTFGTEQARNQAVLGVGAQMNIDPTMKVSLSYQGQIGSGSRENGLMGNFNWSF